MSFLVNPFTVGTGAYSDVNLGDGMWADLHAQRAIAVGGVPAVGAIQSDGDLVVHRPGGSVVLSAGFGTDDHNNPTLLKRSSDSKILAFASVHNGANLYMWTSTNADDASAFGSSVDLDSQLGQSAYTYASAVQLNDETNDPIYLFFRAGGATKHFYYSTSTDNGATWSAATQLFANNGDNASFPPYTKMMKNGEDRIDFFMTEGHPDYTASNGIYHCYYEAGSFRKSDGTALTLPITPATHLTAVYDVTNMNCSIRDVAVDGSGNPVAVFTASSSPADLRYKYAKWNGSSFTVNDMCSGGATLIDAEPHYAGSVCLDPDDPSRVFASRNVGGIGQMFRYVTSDGGATWTSAMLTDGVETAMRPFMVSGVSEPRLAYVVGTYTSSTSFNTDIILMDSTSAAVRAFDEREINVRLQVYGQGADGSTSFTDTSSTGRTLTANGNVQNDTGVDIYGTSILFDGVGDFISAPDASDLTIGTLADFCVHGWVRCTDLTHINTILDKRDSAGAEEFSFQLDATTGTLSLVTYGGGASRGVATSSTGTSINTTYHVAGTRQGTTLRVFIDGVLKATATQTGVVDSNASELRIGRNGFNTARDFEGNLNGIEFIIGDAVWTADFTPPTPPY